MKRRTKRDLGVLLGAIVIIGVVAFANSQFGRTNLASEFEELREKLEGERVSDALIKWNIIRQTKGKLRTGGKFAEELKADDGKEALIVGFMVPNETYRKVEEFLLLPIPLECYFCSMPPERDVLYVKLREGETSPIYAEPILLRGTFNLHPGPDQKYFYSMTNATLEAALDGGDLTNKRIGIEHMVGPGDHEKSQKDLRPADPARKDDTN